MATFHRYQTSDDQRSTMTALTEVQKQWAENSENKEKNRYPHVGFVSSLRLFGHTTAKFFIKMYIQTLPI